MADGARKNLDSGKSAKLLTTKRKHRSRTKRATLISFSVMVIELRKIQAAEDSFFAGGHDWEIARSPQRMQAESPVALTQTFRP